MCQFAFGFSIAGHLSKKYLLEPDGKEQDKLHPTQLYDTARPRFRERAAESGHKHAQVLWAEALEQVGKGWLIPPQQLRLDDRPLPWKSDSFNISLRLGGLQADKLRSCDDLKHTLNNLARDVSTPLKLVSRGHIAQISHLLSKKGGDWVLFKADRESSYKKLPTDPSDQKNAIVFPRRPVSKIWYGFVARTLSFGSIAAVLHYGAISRILVSFTNRVLGIPRV